MNPSQPNDVHPRPAINPSPEPKGLVLVADGIGGLDLCAGNLHRLVARSEQPMEVRTVRWGHGVGRWLADLTRSPNVLRHAGLAAEQVLAFREQSPGAPVFFVGKSGGSGVVLRALEKLPEGSVERVVLLAPAVSPGYDLSRALAAVNRELVVFRSPLDFALLGFGTWAFGTIDRVRGVGAGLVGFLLPDSSAEPERRARYDKTLRQVVWRPSMIRVAYFGGHLAVDLPPFLKRFVIPMLSAGPIDLDAILDDRARQVTNDPLNDTTAASSPARPSS